MTRIVEGTAAVLDKPMRKRQLLFADPSPLLWTEGAPVTRNGQEVGTVTMLRRDDRLIHWAGLLDEEPIRFANAPVDPLIVPMPELSLAELIEAGRLVGVTDLTQGEMGVKDGCTVLSQWSVASIALLDAAASPWPELTLMIR